MTDGSGAVVAGDETRTAAQTLALATLSITLGALPVFLVGSLAVFIREELHFGAAALGVAASLYYVASAVAAIPGGALSERVGAYRAMALAAVGTAFAMIGIAAFARNWMTLVALLVVGGACHGFALPAGNLAVARGFPTRRQGLAFGLKQTAGPLSTLVAGSAVPLLGLTIGWRWAFVITGAATLPVILAGGSARPEAAPALRVRGDVATGPLVILAGAGACATIAGSSLGAFYVVSAVAGGVSPGAAGTMLALGSGLGIATRIGWGWLGDKMPSRHFGMLATMLSVGAVGFALLGWAGGGASLVLATILIFAAGWAWPGLLYFAIVLRTPKAPAVATGIIATGVFLGGMLGPTVFGALVERSSYETAWLFVGASLVASAVLMLVAARRLAAAPLEGAADVGRAEMRVEPS